MRAITPHLLISYEFGITLIGDFRAMSYSPVEGTYNGKTCAVS